MKKKIIVDEMIDSRLIRLIEDYVGKIDCLNIDIEEVDLYHNLHIYGDDADELLTKYSKEFNVSLKDFCFSNFFPYEGDCILPAIWRFLIGRKTKKYKQLTIGDLQKGIHAGILK